MDTLPNFIKEFMPVVEEKAKALNKAVWILETTGNSDAQDLVALLDTDLRILFSDRAIYERLLQFKEEKIEDPLLKRQLDNLIRSFKGNMIPKELAKEIAQKEAALTNTYANFRPVYKGKTLNENEILEFLKTEKNVSARKEIWEKSKEIGDKLAPQILEVIKLRNQAAQTLGYPDYFQMQLDLQEVDQNWLQNFFSTLSEKSQASYDKLIRDIEIELQKKYGIKEHEFYPWFWKDPFCQEDPIPFENSEEIYKSFDLLQAAKSFYQQMELDVESILSRSDLFEREKKNQHAFCINIDHCKDVRTLMNIKPSQRWMDTILHELGHAVYDLGYDASLPWSLRSPPHMITTEAMALMAGREATNPQFLQTIAKVPLEVSANLEKLKESAKRRQLIFSRWVLVITAFEKEMYKNPDQDLNALWWNLIEKYQKITPPDRKGHNDWAAKYHVGLAPVYYFSYLLGEVFASGMKEKIATLYPNKSLFSKEASQFLQGRLFFPGDRYSWDKLIEHVLDQPLSCDAWVKEFAY
jgi:peptidyl-dipeptidase A